MQTSGVRTKPIEIKMKVNITANMKNRCRQAAFAAVMAVVLLSGRLTQAQTTNLLVDVPVPPDEIQMLDERCNYIVDNYWKRLNYKGAFSSLERMDATLGQFFALTPYASRDTVEMALNSLITGVEKADAKNLVTLARMAERWCATDTAEYASEDLMLPFARAVAESKKVKGPEKEYYAAMARRMSNSRRGVAPADFEFYTPGKAKGRLSDITDPTVLLFFYDPDNIDCRLDRIRLGNDLVVKILLQNSLLKIVAVYPGEPDEKWEKDAADMPDGWIIGAAPGIDKDFTIKKLPDLYFLDQDRVITDKDFSTESAIRYFGQFARQRPAAPSDTK